MVVNVTVELENNISEIFPVTLPKKVKGCNYTYRKSLLYLTNCRNAVCEIQQDTWLDMVIFCTWQMHFENTRCTAQ